jgi:thiamine biosynthesis protein ThiS
MRAKYEDSPLTQIRHSAILLVINEEERNYTAAMLDALADSKNWNEGDRVAAELNREIVSRGSWNSNETHDDRLEIVHSGGGGIA